MPVRVAVVYSESTHERPEDHWLLHSGRLEGTAPPDFHDASEPAILAEAQAIAECLRQAGYEPLPFCLDDVAHLSRFLQHERPDVIFNLCESFRGQSAAEMQVAALYELFGIPYTGSSALTLGIARDKGITKALLRAHDLLTPPYVILDEHAPCDAAYALGVPLIVKPVSEDASTGIDRHAVVWDMHSLARRVAFIVKEFEQPALVETFIEGRELSVGVLASSRGELTTLPILEVLFDALPPDIPRVVGYETKWVTESPLAIPVRLECPAQLDADVARLALALAVRAARAIGLRDYGRIDLRVRERDGAIFVLDVNPNPDFWNHDGNSPFMRQAKASGRTYAGLVREILEHAIERAVR